MVVRLRWWRVSSWWSSTLLLLLWHRMSSMGGHTSMVGNANSICIHSICLCNRAVLVSQQKRLQVNNLVPEHRGLVLKVLVIRGEVLDLGL